MEKAGRLAFPGLLTAALLGVCAVEALRSGDRIVENLKIWSPVGLAAASVAAVILAVFAWPAVKGLFKGRLTKGQWAAAAVLPAIAFLLAFAWAPRTHRIYYDENIYLHIGQSIAETGRAQMVNFGEIRDGKLVADEGEYNKQPNAYPFLLALVYRIAGESESVSFLFNNLVFAGAAFLVFLLGVLLFEEFKAGLYAAAAFVVIPQNILWHNTTAVEPSNTAAIVLTMFLTFAFVRAPRLPLFFLAVTAAVFASQFRMESLLVFPLMLIFLLIDGREVFRDPKAYDAVPLGLLLLLPHILHLLYFQGHPWGAAGQERFGLAALGRNLATNGPFFLNNKEFPVLLTAAALAAFLFRRKRTEKMQAGIWLLAFWGVFLFFYAGSFHYGADVRFSLMAFPPLALLAGAGLADLDRAAAKKPGRKSVAIAGPLLIAASFLMFARAAGTVGEEAWAARADHHYAKEMLAAIPEDAIVFTHNPNMFLFWGRSSAQASILAGYDAARLAALRERFPGGIFFHYNFWCSVADPVQQGFCKSILDKFPHAEIVRYQEREYAYVLYKIE